MSKFRGIAIGLMGFCVVAVSVGCAFLFDSKEFAVAAIAGWCIALCGFVVHLFTMPKLRKR